MNLAPVAVGTYSRLAHFKQTTEALKKNTLARDTELYVLSDAPQAGDEAIVQAVRDFADSITGFKKVHVLKRTTNGRVANNRGGMRQLLKEFGRVIFLEDDMVSAPGFLQYMNDALSKYEHHSKVLSVCGYMPRLKALENNTQTNSDSIALPRMLGWGMGIWKQKFEQINAISIEDYKSVSSSASDIEYVNSNFGKDLINRFKAEAHGHLDGLDTKGCFLQLKHNMFSVHPKRSLIKNVGNDGSGVHASVNNKYDVDLCPKTKNFVLDDFPCVLETIRQQSIEFFAPNEEDMSPEIIDNILAQIENQNLTDICLWGTDVLTTLFLAKLPVHIRVSHIVDSWAKPNECFQAYPVILPQQAYDLGNRIFVIMSFASRHKIAKAAHQLGDGCHVIQYSSKQFHSIRL